MALPGETIDKIVFLKGPRFALLTQIAGLFSLGLKIPAGGSGISIKACAAV